jgi:hypothetical protein
VFDVRRGELARLERPFLIENNVFLMTTGMIPYVTTSKDTIKESFVDDDRFLTSAETSGVELAASLEIHY